MNDVDSLRGAVGLTTTIPVEVLFAAGCRPVDLNNVFITSDDPAGMIADAEEAGFPRNLCAWVKGIYSAVHKLGISKVIAVVQGDCSNTHALMEVLEAEGVEIIDFAFPYRRDAELLDAQIDRLCALLGTTRRAAEEQKGRLDGARAAARKIDELCAHDAKATGGETHLWTVSTSDFNGDPEAFTTGARDKASEISAREAEPDRLRLGYVGVPPIVDDFYDFIRSLGAEVVFNEVQRQFTMPFNATDLVDAYSQYTYPYDVFHRIDDIAGECRRRSVAGVVHYVQSFCFRGIQDRLIRDGLDLPVLTLEFDRPGGLDSAARTRVETFVEMLRG